jgi:hypothetical protein
MSAEPTRGFGSLFPRSFWISSLVALIMLSALAATTRGSNYLVQAGLLVSMQKPHLITLPGVFHNVGMSVRTSMALLGILLFIGGVFTLISRAFERDELHREPPPPPPPPPAPEADPPAVGMPMGIPMTTMPTTMPMGIPMTTMPMGIPMSMPPQGAAAPTAPPPSG